MKRIIHICLWLLTGIFAEVSLSAQNPFIYHKGKTYKDVAAYRMEEIIDLNTHTPSTPILCEQQVPEHQSTLSYKVALPLYVRGIFFSRDSRPGDYQWPNNTNRLLPSPLDVQPSRRPHTERLCRHSFQCPAVRFGRRTAP